MATVSGHAVQLGWTDASDNENSFRVERKLSSSSTWTAIATPAANSTAYEDNTVNFGQSYDYRVFAVGDAGNSAASNLVSVDIPAAPPVITVPVAPHSLAAVVEPASAAQPTNIIQLSWTDASDNETGFRVERRLSGKKPWKSIATVPVNEQGYEDDSVEFDETYEYRVIATNLAGDSLPSNEVTVNSPAEPVVEGPEVPEAPQDLEVEVTEADTRQPANIFRLSWDDASDNETGFRIERRKAGKRQWKSIATVDAGIESYDDTIVGADGRYEYRVFATGVAGDSLPSNEVTADSEVDSKSILADSTGAAGSFDLISMFFLMLFAGAGIFRTKNR